MDYTAVRGHSYFFSSNQLLVAQGELLKFFLLR